MRDFEGSFVDQFSSVKRATSRFVEDFTVALRLQD
jgi:hypothetical protein